MRFVVVDRRIYDIKKNNRVDLFREETYYSSSRQLKGLTRRRNVANIPSDYRANFPTLIYRRRCPC
jgi:hypothetical protein